MTLNGAFKSAAKSALADWYASKYQVQEQELDNLTNDLWVWYLERAAVREKVDNAEPKLRHSIIHRYALQRLAECALESDRFHGKSLFSSESVKDALKGRSTNKYLKAILPIALDAIQHKDDQVPGREYAEALRKRYEDNEIPQSKHEENKLFYAHKALTDEVNVNYLTTDVDGIGSSKYIFPGLRKRNGENADPTGDAALMLLDPDVAEKHPGIWDEYLTPTAWQQVCRGAASEPAYQVGPVMIRPSAGSYPNWMLLKHPELLDVYVDAKKQEFGW